MRAEGVRGLGHEGWVECVRGGVPRVKPRWDFGTHGNRV